ncbi:MAG: hypothetical protein LC541_11860 [Candidatus Thiodiazotropha sp.]|nr:hypothetical protein [Candidatus Thiodiazotropha sp.]MCM8883969.1 hypothetical protein [Candidatus Thiodiazotropha sp.]MCM8922106.1 hypothetical protein [Candidatus Thiodiazotropha sp.]
MALIKLVGLGPTLPLLLGLGGVSGWLPWQGCHGDSMGNGLSSFTINLRLLVVSVLAAKGQRCKAYGTGLCGTRIADSHQNLR